MLNFIQGIYQMAGTRYRRDLKLIVTLMFIHFAALVFIQYAIQAHTQQLLSKSNSIFGFVWTTSCILFLWMRGGMPLDTILATSFFHADYVDSREAKRLARKAGKFANSIVRIIVGFFLCETIVNLCFAIVPFFSDGDAFWALLSPVMCYFMLRYMANEHINWRRWIWLPMFNIAILLGSILLNHTRTNNPEVLNWFSTLSLNSRTMLWLGPALIVIALVLGNLTSTTAPSTAKKEDHHE